MPLISLAAIAATCAENSGDTPVCLVKIEHDDLAEPLLFCSAAAERISTDPFLYGIVSGGETYIYAERMAARLPDRNEAATLETSLVFDNNDTDIIEAIESIFTPFFVTISVVLASTPNVVEASFPGLLCRLIRADMGTISVDLSDDVSSMEPAAADRMSNDKTPGVHIQ